MLTFLAGTVSPWALRGCLGGKAERFAVFSSV